MNEKIKQRWVKALRSGKYKQGKGVLCDKDRNTCCLGVLTDLYIKSKNRTRKRKLKWKWLASEGGFAIHGEACVLPGKVQEWAGLSSDNPAVDEVNLSMHNDGRGANPCFHLKKVTSKKFPAIAKLIEKHL